MFSFLVALVKVGDLSQEALSALRASWILQSPTLVLKSMNGILKTYDNTFSVCCLLFKSLTTLMKAEASGADHHAVGWSKGCRERKKKTFLEITYRLELPKDKWSGQNCLKGCFIFFCPLFVLMAPTRMIFDWVPPGGDSDVSTAR